MTSGLRRLYVPHRVEVEVPLTPGRWAVLTPTPDR